MVHRESIFSFKVQYYKGNIGMPDGESTAVCLSCRVVSDGSHGSVKRKHALRLCVETAFCYHNAMTGLIPQQKSCI